MTTTITLTVGDLVHVDVPGVRYLRKGYKARLSGFSYYEGTSGQHLGALVTFTADKGAPFSHERRERGETQTVPFSNVKPRTLPGESYRVDFQYDPNIAGYANVGIVATVRHGRPTPPDHQMATTTIPERI